MKRAVWCVVAICCCVSTVLAQWPAEVPPAVAPADVAPATGAGVPLPPAAAPTALAPATVAVVAPPPPPVIWKGSFELGLNGTDGNSDSFNLRTGGKIKREGKHLIIGGELDYHKNSAGSLETAHRALFDGRVERIFQDSPWTLFGHMTTDYDEFQAFDWRLGLDSGVGYNFIKNDCTRLVGRIGSGVSREFGGPDDSWVPELLVGAELEHKLTKRQKICLSFEYTPDVTDFADYRANAKASWEVLLDEEMHLSLKFSAIERYDSTPHGREPGDLDYAATVLWSF